MPSIRVIKQLVREVLAKKDSYRIPEPDLIMESIEQANSFYEAGREGGVMSPVYLFHTVHISEVIRPGETVLDLGCGPANQLAMVARINPDVSFVGLDLSSEMLALAEKNLSQYEVTNTKLRVADITDLGFLENNSVDAVMSTVVLHHLADETSLFSCFQEVARVLKPSGGLYLVDFGHLKTDTAIRSFANQYVDRQPEVFTIDYLNSLKAAFEIDTWRTGYGRYLKEFGNLYSTFAVPYMVCIKSEKRRSPTAALQHDLLAIKKTMPKYHLTDFRDLRTFFRLGGLFSKLA